MANLVARGGRVNIRLGGNTQETAVYVDKTADGKAIEKDKGNVGNPVSFDYLSAAITLRSPASPLKRHKRPLYSLPPKSFTCVRTSQR